MMTDEVVRLSTKYKSRFKEGWIFGGEYSIVRGWPSHFETNEEAQAWALAHHPDLQHDMTLLRLLGVKF